MAAGGFARVAVARPTHRTFHYSVPAALARWAVPGARCVVPFGRGRVTGFVVAVDDRAEVDRVLDLLDVLDREPVLPPALLELGLWLSRYYHHPPGLTLSTLLPPAFRARTEAVLRPADRAGAPNDPGEAGLLLRIRSAGGLDPGDLGARDLRVAARLVQQGWIAREWTVVQPPAPRPTRWYRLSPGAPGPAEVAGRSPRQAQVLEALAGGALPGPVLRAQGVRADALRRACDRGWVVREDAPPRAADLEGLSGQAGAVPEPTPEQAAAVARIERGLETGRFETVLLHGVTGSGKTEVYLRAVAAARRRGLAALVLVPEIALTPQLLGRFLARFGADVAVLHSGLGSRERLLQWQRIRSGEAGVVVGVRSAVFAPVGRLGLVVVDEEHEPSYKQEKDLRYHGKHAALVRARRDGAVAVLGSATPDVESWWAAGKGRYRLATLPRRVGGGRPPGIRVVDLRQEDARRGRRTVLSGPLRKAVARAFERGEQALLFLNRRGFSPALACTDCGEALRCGRCAVALTLHRPRGRETLVCHYCGATRPAPRDCPGCGSSGLGPVGIGTQRLVEAARAAWPGARIVRLDRDTARRAGGIDVLEAFRTGKADLLVGTQMVAKGHHFPRLTVVGVVDADTALHLPDFRAGERTFQLLTQVAGRAGREVRPGTVYVQTRIPDHPVIEAVARDDYAAFAEAELRGRQEVGYPPFRRLALVQISSREPAVAARGAAAFADRAVEAARPHGVDVLGPAPAPLERLRGRWRHQVLLRAPGPEPGPLQAVLRVLVPAAGRADRDPDLRVGFDVDPVSLL